MRKFLLLVCLGMALSPTTFAQLGKMQYEDAEEQFAAGKFREALALLDESEKTMGKSNPMIEHLRIMARTELLKQDIAKNIDQLEIGRKEAKAFLLKYDGDTRVEDKYRDVYKASKTLADFPSREELEKRAAEEKRKEAEAILTDAQNFLTGYRDGMPDQEAKSKIARFSTEHENDKLRLLYFEGTRHILLVSPKTGLSFGYFMRDDYPKSDKECTLARKAYEEKKDEITRVLGVSPTEGVSARFAIPEGSFFGWGLDFIRQQAKAVAGCVWQKGTKTIRLALVCENENKRRSDASVLLSSENSRYK